MEYKTFKEISLSRLGMGNMRLPTRGNGPMDPVDYDKAQEIIDYAMAHGINYYDTAYVYHGGDSEKFLGQALKKYPRESYHLATKFFIMANPDYKQVFEEQLERLQTDYIDFYLIHGIFDNAYQQYLDCGCIDYFLEQKKLGRIKYLGFSSHASVKNLTTFAGHHEWDFAQLQLNYFDWLFAHTKEEYEVLTSRNIPVMVMEPVRGGRLASLSPEMDAVLKAAHPDWSIASWALRWVRRLPNVQVILSGMSSMEQIQDNIATFSEGGALSDEDTKLLLEVCEKFHNQVKVPCTACRYCCENCPAKINIPEYLKVYNASQVEGAWVIGDMLAAITSEGKPADCIGCGSCSGHCPQGIDVPDIMGKLAEMMK
ncbi:MAG: aldo/keto reductase [Clostridium sp.]|nr:aldo/keto reductase [Clostridium sp.]